MDKRGSKRKLRVINRRWLGGLTLSVLCVVAAIVGILVVQAGCLSRPWVYGFLVLGLLGAVTAMLQTIMRSKSGDKIDEAKL
ncbi:MAG: hypothetical protein JWQ70_2137 [Aeromicrobium sp.]|nr:hypothetical protein [Aeromicrobium sp.]